MPKLREILLVDDSDADNYFHRRVINKMGCAEAITEKPHGQAAIDYLTTANDAGVYPQPELVFLDINMPVMNGWDFLVAYQNLREEQKAGVVVVMLTTSFDEQDRDRALAFDVVSDHLGKPLRPESLKQVLEAHFPDAIP